LKKKLRNIKKLKTATYIYMKLEIVQNVEYHIKRYNNYLKLKI